VKLASDMATIRRLRKGEADLYRKMRLQSIADSPSAFETTYDAVMARSPESWRDQADESADGSDRATFLAFAGEEPIGIAALYRVGVSADVGELLQVWVAPGHRGTGVARALMDALFAWAGKCGYRQVVAKVTSGNERALAFYKNYGFALADEPVGGGTGTRIISRSVPTGWAKSSSRE